MLNVNKIKKLTNKVFKQLGNLKTKIVYYVINQPTYVSDTGVITTNKTEYSLSGFFVDYAEDNKAEHILDSDKKLFIYLDDLPIVPTVGDEVKDVADKIWIVLYIKTEISLYELHVRPA